MTHENFCYWLQGYDELSGGKPLDARGWQVLRDHLSLVFNKVTPVRERKMYDHTQIPDSTTYCVSRDIPFGAFPGNIVGDTVPVLTRGLVKLETKRNCGSTDITYKNLSIYDTAKTFATTC